MNKNSIEKVYYQCPKCGTKPQSKIFGTVIISARNQKNNREPKIHCPLEFCNFIGSLEDFIKLEFDNGNR